MTAMTMCYSGAKNETSKQLKELLNLQGLNDNDIMELNKDLLTTVNTKLGTDILINVCNKIYPSIGFEINKEFSDIITKKFYGEIQQLNYSDAVKSSTEINEWVSSKTNNKINNLIPSSSINSMVRLILVNAIYFKGNWLDKFNPAHTSKEDFNLADGSKVKVDMMKLNGKSFNVLYDVEGLSATLCKIPYAGNTISMTIILPNEGVKLNDVERQVNSKKIHEVLSRQFYKEKVYVKLPKFKLEYSIELSEQFKKMGAVLPFNDNADFSGISSDQKISLKISQVLHKAIVDVNEEGTEAAAATAAIMISKGICIQLPREFFCDRPFLFIIHDNIQNNILFLGKYVKPV